MRLSFVYVNHQSTAYLLQSIASVEKHCAAIPHEIIVVQNDGTPLLLDDQINIIHEKNRGFGAACNAGAKIATGDILFFLNPDTEILSSDFKTLCESLEKESASIVAPVLITPDHVVQQWSFGSEITFVRILFNQLLATKKLSTNNMPCPFFVDWVSGGAFAIRRSLFQQMHGFDEKFFMYFEDVDLCKRLQILQKNIMVLPTFQILHHGGKSTPQEKQKKLYYASQDYYFKKYSNSIIVFFIKMLRILTPRGLRARF